MWFIYSIALSCKFVIKGIMGKTMSHQLPISSWLLPFYTFHQLTTGSPLHDRASHRLRWKEICIFNIIITTVALCTLNINILSSTAGMSEPGPYSTVTQTDLFIQTWIESVKRCDNQIHLYPFYAFLMSSFYNKIQGKPRSSCQLHLKTIFSPIFRFR